MQAAPNLIHVGEQIMALAFHPTENIVAVGGIDGDLKCYHFERTKDFKIEGMDEKHFEHHTEKMTKNSFSSSLIFSSEEITEAKEKKENNISLRSVEFSPTSNIQSTYIACGYSNGTLRRYDLSKKKFRLGSNTRT